MHRFLESQRFPDSTGSLLATPVTLAVLALTVSVSCYIMYQFWFSPLAKIPGPSWAKVTDFWRARQVLNGEQHRTLMELHKRHGAVVRIGPNELSIADPVAFKRIYNPAKPFRKSSYYDPWSTGHDMEIFAQRNESLHGKARRRIAKAFSMEAIKLIEHRLDASVSRFLEFMKRFDGQDIYFGKHLALFAHDFVHEASFSHTSGALEAESDHGLMENVRSWTKAATCVGQVPWVFTFINPVISLLVKLSIMRSAEESITGALEKPLADRIARLGSVDGKADKNNDMAATLLLSNTQAGTMSKQDVAFALSANVVAGVGDIPVVLISACYYLVKNPSKKDALLAELKQKKSDSRLGQLVSYDQAKEYPYLQAVIYEALRLHPVAPGTLQREVPEGGLQAGKYFVPPGVVVGTPAWVINRHPEIWGEDPDAFRPERWLDEDRKREMLKYFFTFGGGTRTCLGKNLSLMAASKLIPNLLHNFQIEPSKVVPDWTVTAHGSVHQSNFHARLFVKK